MQICMLFLYNAKSISTGKYNDFVIFVCMYSFEYYPVRKISNEISLTMQSL